MAFKELASCVLLAVGAYTAGLRSAHAGGPNPGAGEPQAPAVAQAAKQGQKCSAEKQGTWSPMVGNPKPYEIEVSANEGEFIHLDYYSEVGEEAISHVIVGGGPAGRKYRNGFGSKWVYRGEECTLESVTADVKRYAKQRRDAGAGHSGEVIVLGDENAREAGSGGGQAPSESEGNDGVCKARRLGDAEDGALYKAPPGTAVIEAWKIDGSKPSINGKEYGSVRIMMETPVEPGKAIPNMKGAVWLFGHRCGFPQVVNIERKKNDPSPIVIVSPDLKIRR